MTGDGGADNAGPWVRLRDAPGRFVGVGPYGHGPGEGDATLWRDLLLEVQERPAEYRSRISAPDGMASDGKSAPVTPRDFPGVDWVACDLLSDKPGDSAERLRFPLEVWWPAVVAYAKQRRGRLERRRERLALLSPKTETPPSAAIRPALGQLMELFPAVAERQKPGPRPEKRDTTVTAMQADIASGKETLESLKGAKQETLAAQYSVSRRTIRAALDATERRRRARGVHPEERQGHPPPALPQYRGMTLWPGGASEAAQPAAADPELAMTPTAAPPAPSPKRARQRPKTRKTSMPENSDGRVA